MKLIILFLMFARVLNSQIVAERPLYRSNNADSEFDVAINPKEINMERIP